MLARLRPHLGGIGRDWPSSDAGGRRGECFFGTGAESAGCDRQRLAAVKDTVGTFPTTDTGAASFIFGQICLETSLLPPSIEWGALARWSCLIHGWRRSEILGEAVCVCLASAFGGGGGTDLAKASGIVGLRLYPAAAAVGRSGTTLDGSPIRSSSTLLLFCAAIGSQMRGDAFERRSSLRRIVRASLAR